MTLKELIQQHTQPSTGAPDWLLGCFKRYSISFADGRSDLKTRVFWLQSRNFTIDIRLPMQSEQLAAKALEAYTTQELVQLADYEGFSATTDWDGNMLVWRQADAAKLIHDRWTEPAFLKRVGNCMMEFCPSDAYLEDWRAQPTTAGSLVGLRLIEERALSTGNIRHKGGGLIVCGDYAGLVLGRPTEIAKPRQQTTLSDLVLESTKDKTRLAELFNFETSIAKGSLDTGFQVAHSTWPNRVGQTIFPLDGFEAPSRYQHETLGEIDVIRQKLMLDGEACERIFTVDTIEPNFVFDQTTKIPQETADWFARESAILTRYAEVLA